MHRSLPRLKLPLAILQRDHALDLPAAVDHAIDTARSHALGAGIDEGLEFGLAGDLLCPSLIGEALDRVHGEHIR